MIPVINSVFLVFCSSVFGLFGSVFGHDQIDQNIGREKGNRYQVGSDRVVSRAQENLQYVGLDYSIVEPRD